MAPGISLPISCRSRRTREMIDASVRYSHLLDLIQKVSIPNDAEVRQLAVCNTEWASRRRSSNCVTSSKHRRNPSATAGPG